MGIGMKGFGDMNDDHAGWELDLFFTPESRARRAAKAARWEAGEALKEAERARDAVEWREKLLAERDPAKAATPIFQPDALPLRYRDAYGPRESHCPVCRSGGR